MANLIVTSFTKTIEVDFGTLSQAVGYEEAVFHKANITFQLDDQEDYIRVESINGDHWTVTDGASAQANPSMDALVIDSINGVSPTDLNDLYTKLKTLIRVY